MKYNTYVSGTGFTGGDGALEFQNGEFIIYKKSAAARILFGAIGASMASGKEVQRFRTEDIISCNMVKKMLGSTLTINLKNGGNVTVGWNKKMEAELMPVIGRFLNGTAF